jgi:Armadillo/beta-catenin-like repeat
MDESHALVRPVKRDAGPAPTIACTLDCESTIRNEGRRGSATLGRIRCLAAVPPTSSAVEQAYVPSRRAPTICRRRRSSSSNSSLPVSHFHRRAHMPFVADIQQQENMIDDLQTLCVAALRRRLVSARGTDGGRSGSGSASTRRGRRAVVDAILECVELKDRPLLQCEAASALAGVCDRLTPKERKVVKYGAIPNLFPLLLTSDADVQNQAGAVLLEILDSESDDRRNLVLGPLVRRVMGNDSAAQKLATARFALLLSIPDDPPIQRVADSGVVPRLVEFLLREDAPKLQLEAEAALVSIALGTPAQAKVVLDSGAIPYLFRLLHSPDDEGKVDAARALGLMAGANLDSRDFLLRNRAMPQLLPLINRSASSPAVVRRATWAASALCWGHPPPPLALVRPALPTLSRLLLSSDHGVVEAVCSALSDLTDGPNELIRAVAAAGVCRRIVPLLRHPSSEVQRCVHCQWLPGVAVSVICPLTPSSFWPFAFCCKQLRPRDSAAHHEGGRPAEEGDSCV